jgi:hypothetical protein
MAARRTRQEAPIMRLLLSIAASIRTQRSRWRWNPGTPRCRAGRRARHGRQQLSRVGCLMVAIG